jgi:hypothetical protein
LSKEFGVFKALIMSLCALLFSLSLLIRPAHSQTLSEQIVSDLLTVGITGAATLSGNIPLAMASGVLSKYISTYGVQAVKFLINQVKAESPQDLGEINIYFVYLIHVKRNLYHSMINLRNNVKSDGIDETLMREIEELEKKMKGGCPQGECAVTGLDETLVNFEFLNVALDAHAQDIQNLEQVFTERERLREQGYVWQICSTTKSIKTATCSYDYLSHSGEEVCVTRCLKQPQTGAETMHVKSCLSSFIPNNCFTKNPTAAGYDDGYDDGYDSGYDVGYDRGYDAAYDSAYNSGYDYGYSAGFSAGYSDGYSDYSTDDGRPKTKTVLTIKEILSNDERSMG